MSKEKNHYFDESIETKGQFSSIRGDEINNYSDKQIKTKYNFGNRNSGGSGKIIPIGNITLSPKKATIKVNEKQQLTAKIDPDDATNKKINWSSSDQSVAKVENNGLVTGLKVGNATIQAEAADGFGALDTSIITVENSNVPVESVSMTPKKASIDVGKTTKLKAEVNPADSTNKNVTFESQDSSIATVDNTGLVTGVAAGSAVITVTTEDGGKTDTSTITVNNVEVTGVSLDKTEISLEIGAKQKLVATIAPPNATIKTVTWSSDNEGNATVDEDGNVTAVKEGSATITVTTTDSNKTATCVVTVTDAIVAVTGVTIDPKSAAVNVGETTQLTATVEPENATNKKVTWSAAEA